MGYIYKISNSINSKVYIGLTTNPIEYRFRQHKYLAENGINRALYCAMRKYGINNFCIEQIEECDNSILKQRATKINNISYACSGRIKTAGGFKWKYIDEVNNESNYL